MTEFTSTVTLTFEINNLEAFDKEEYIEKHKEVIYKYSLNNPEVQNFLTISQIS